MKFIAVFAVFAAAVSAHYNHTLPTTSVVANACSVTTIYKTVTGIPVSSSTPAVHTPSAPGTSKAPTGGAPYPTGPVSPPSKPVGTGIPSQGLPSPSAPSISYKAPPTQFTGAANANGVPAAVAGLLAAAAWIL